MSKVDTPKTMTDFQLLKELVPDISERLEKGGDIVKELKRRSVERNEGYRPFHWMQGFKINALPYVDND